MKELLAAIEVSLRTFQFYRKRVGGTWYKVEYWDCFKGYEFTEWTQEEPDFSYSRQVPIITKKENHPLRIAA